VHGPDPSQVIVKLDPYVDALGAAQFSDPQQTADLLARLSAEFPESTGILDLLLDAQLGAGRTELAIATLRRGTEVAPKRQRYWTGLGELLSRLARDAEARVALDAALSHFPCDVPTRTNLASVHARTGERAKQIAVLEQGVAECQSPPE